MSYQPHYFQEVRKAQQESYSPYSQFKVGAYLKTKDGRTLVWYRQFLKDTDQVILNQ